jgi:hypothetical protein
MLLVFGLIAAAILLGGIYVLFSPLPGKVNSSVVDRQNARLRREMEQSVYSIIFYPLMACGGVIIWVILAYFIILIKNSLGYY